MVYILSNNVEFGVIGKGLQEIGLRYVTGLHTAVKYEHTLSFWVLEKKPLIMSYSFKRKFLFLSSIFILGPFFMATGDPF